MNAKLMKMLKELAEENGYMSVYDLLQDYNWEISVRPHNHTRAELILLLLKNHQKKKNNKN